jgi:catecholate siderophore receptor
VADCEYLRTQFHHRRPLGRLGGGEVDADQQFHAVGELHPHQSARLPDFGVPYNTVAGAPVTSAGIPRQTYYGFIDRDFQVATQDIGTITSDYRVSDALTFTNKFRDEHSVLNYIGTIPEQGSGPTGCNTKGGNFTNPNPAAWVVCLNPQSRFQTTDVLDDQALTTLKFNTGPVLNTLVSGAEISRETVSIDSYSGLTSETLGPVAFANGTVGPVSVLNPPNFLPFGNATVTGNPSVIPVDTKSLFALETANYRDFLIFTAGLRFDNYNISASKNGFPTVSAQSNMVNYNLGLVVKPLPTASVYAAYGTSSNPVGAELDGTSANYGGLQLTNASINQIFGPVEAKAVEVGTKWEFFNRHLLATGRCSVPTSAMRANSFQRGFRMPGRSRPAPPITCRASISEPRARSWTSSASLAASC